jgi:hypothetical protein
MIFLSATALLWKRLRSGKNAPWALLFLTGTAVTGIGDAPLPWLSSLAAFGFPAVVALGWRASPERRGLLLICERNQRAVHRLAATEIMIPAAAGILPASLAALASGAVPWQFWLVAPLTSLAAAASLILLERLVPPGGLVLLALYWTWSFHVSGSLTGWIRLLLLPLYPGSVLSAAQGNPHADAFVACSAAMAGLLAALLFRVNLKASFRET